MKPAMNPTREYAAPETTGDAAAAELMRAIERAAASLRATPRLAYFTTPDAAGTPVAFGFTVAVASADGELSGTTGLQQLERLARLVAAKLRSQADHDLALAAQLEAAAGAAAKEGT